MKQRNKYIALILLLLISIKSLIVPVVYLDFEMRKDYIIKNLCENRYKPELKCNGACYLAKKINKLAENKATNETNKQSQSIKKVMQEVFEIKEIPVFMMHYILKQVSSNTFYQIQFPFGSKNPVFHPPTV